MDTTTTYNERELIDRIAAGDEQAFEIIFRKYHHNLGLHIYSILKSRELAEEITQDVFLKIWQTREALTEVRSFKDYLFIMTRNRAIDGLQKLARERNLNQDLGGLRDLQDQDSQDFKEKGLDLIDQAINILPERQKQCYIMSRRDKLSYDEIAKMLGIGKESVKSHIRAATANISKFVKSEMDKVLLLLIIFLSAN